MNLIQAQRAYIEQVNSCVRPKDRCRRVRRAASKKLRAYLEKIGVTGELQNHVCRDAWDMAELEHNADD
jgi:hypothetical protein